VQRQRKEAYVKQLLQRAGEKVAVSSGEHDRTNADFSSKGFAGTKKGTKCIGPKDKKGSVDFSTESAERTQRIATRTWGKYWCGGSTLFLGSEKGETVTGPHLR